MSNNECQKHEGQTILGICQFEFCQAKGEYCHDCIPDHFNHFKSLIPLDRACKKLAISKQDYKVTKEDIVNKLEILKLTFQSIDIKFPNDIQSLQQQKYFQEIETILQEIENMGNQTNNLVSLLFNLIEIKKDKVKTNNPSEVIGQANNKGNQEIVKQNQDQLQYQGSLQKEQNQQIDQCDNIKKQEELIEKKEQTFIQSQQISIKQNLPKEISDSLNNQKEKQEQSREELLRETQLNVNKQQQQYRTINLKFSKQQIGKITLENDDLKATGNQFAVCNQIIPKNEGIQFAFQVVSGEYVFVGVCVESIVRKNNYMTSLKKDNLTHGAYLISSYGLAWAHEMNKYNGGKVRLKFDSTDIVIVQIDNLLHRIRWFVVQKPENGQKIKPEITQNNSFSMRYDPTQDLTPCIYVLYNSSVEIVKDLEAYL